MLVETMTGIVSIVGCGPGTGWVQRRCDLGSEVRWVVAISIAEWPVAVAVDDIDWACEGGCWCNDTVLD